MLPFLVDRNWFEDWWYNNRPRQKRQSPTTRLTRLAVCIVLVVGSAVVASQLRSADITSNAHISRTGSMTD